MYPIAGSVGDGNQTNIYPKVCELKTKQNLRVDNFCETKKPPSLLAPHMK